MSPELHTLLTDCLEHLEELHDRFNDADGTPVDAWCEKCAGAPIPVVRPCLACRLRQALKEAA